MEDASAKSFHCLLIEPDDEHAASIEKAIARCASDVTVDRVHDGEQALAHLFQEGVQGALRRPDLIILEVKIPGIDGFEVAARIKSDARLYSVPVVVLTTSGASEDCTRAYRKHVNSYIVKPADGNEFNHLIRDLMHYWSAWNQPALENTPWNEARTPRLAARGLQAYDAPSLRAGVQRSILLIEDDSDDAAVIRRCLESIQGVDFDCVRCEGIDEARQTLGRLDVNIILLDYKLGCDDSLEFLRALRTAGDDRPVIAMTSHGSQYVAVDVVQAGADRYVSKADLHGDHFREAIAYAIQKERRNRAVKQERDVIFNRLATLTCREKEVLELVIDGRTTRQVSEILHRSDSTIKIHRANIMRKMKANTPADLTRMVLASGALDGLKRV